MHCYYFNIRFLLRDVLTISMKRTFAWSVSFGIAHVSDQYRLLFSTTDYYYYYILLSFLLVFFVDLSFFCNLLSCIKVADYLFYVCILIFISIKFTLQIRVSIVRIFSIGMANIMRCQVRIGQAEDRNVSMWRVQAGCW